MDPWRYTLKYVIPPTVLWPGHSVKQLHPTFDTKLLPWPVQPHILWLLQPNDSKSLIPLETPVTVCDLKEVPSLPLRSLICSTPLSLMFFPSFHLQVSHFNACQLSWHSLLYITSLWLFALFLSFRGYLIISAHPTESKQSSGETWTRRRPPWLLPWEQRLSLYVLVPTQGGRSKHHGADWNASLWKSYPWEEFWRKVQYKRPFQGQSLSNNLQPKPCRQCRVLLCSE